VKKALGDYFTASFAVGHIYVARPGAPTILTSKLRDHDRTSNIGVMARAYFEGLRQFRVEYIVKFCGIF
jgi:hypothetical protein